LFRDDR